MSNKIFQKLLSLGMSMLLATSGVVYTQNHVARAETTYVQSNILQITNPVEGGQNNNWTGNYIYYGNYPQDDATGSTKDPIKWRILDTNNAQYVGSGQINRTELETNNGFRFNVGYPSSQTETGYGGRQNAPVGGNGVLLMSDKLLDCGMYHPDWYGTAENNLCWSTSKDNSNKKGSVLWSWLNDKPSSEVYNNREFKDYNFYKDGKSFISKAFTGAEKDGIMDTMVYTEDMKADRNGATSYSGSPLTTISQDKLFIPSYNEMLNTKYGFSGTYGFSNTRVLQNTAYSNAKASTNVFKLRSRGTNNSFAKAAYVAYVNDDGYVSEDGYDVPLLTRVGAVALNLNQESVIFVSEAAESDQSGAEGAKEGAIGAEAKKFVLPTGYSNEYKLTMQGEHDGFSITNKPESLKKSAGSEIELNYTGAKSGGNEYVSMILTQEKEIDNNLKCDEVKYYGKLVKVDSDSLKSGTAKIKLPSDIEAEIIRSRFLLSNVMATKRQIGRVQHMI